MAITKGNVYHNTGTSTSPVLASANVNSTGSGSFWLVMLAYASSSASSGTPQLGGKNLTLVSSTIENGGIGRTEWWKLFDTGTIASGNLSGLTIGNVTWVVQIVEILGADSTTPETHGTVVSSNSGSLQPSTANVSPANTTDYVIGTWLGANTSSITAGAGYTATEAQINAASCGIFSELANAQAGTTSAVTPGFSGGGIGGPENALVFAIKVAPAVPVAPSAPTVGSITTTGASVNPGALTSGATSCNIQVTTAADSTFASPVQTITGATASSNNAITGLTVGTNYIYRTQMVNGAGTTSGPATATTPTLFSAPTALAVSAVAQTTQLSLAWTAPTGNATLTTYNILRSTTNGSGYAQIATSATNSYVDNTGLAGSTNYYYIVQAVNSSGASANSTQGTGTTLTCPAAPTSLVGTPSTGGTPQVSLTWAAGSASDTYKVYRSTSVGGTYTVVSGGEAVAATSFIDTTVVNGQPYYYKISGVDATGEGPQSSASSQEFVGVPPPTGLSATYNAGLGIDLSWTAPAGYTGTGYNVYRVSNATYNGVPHRNHNEQPFVTIPWGTTTFRDRRVGLAVLSGGSTHTYYVTTVNGANESALSTASSPVTFNG